MTAYDLVIVAPHIRGAAQLAVAIQGFPVHGLGIRRAVQPEASSHAFLMQLL